MDVNVGRVTNDLLTRCKLFTKLKRFTIRLCVRIHFMSVEFMEYFSGV